MYHFLESALEKSKKRLFYKVCVEGASLTLEFLVFVTIFVSLVEGFDRLRGLHPAIKRSINLSAVCTLFVQTMTFALQNSTFQDLLSLFSGWLGSLRRFSI